jgi:AcrR family transcriptional regulator
MNSLSIKVKSSSVKRKTASSHKPSRPMASAHAAAAAPRKRRSGKSDQTRAALIAAAQRVFLKRGYVNTEIAQITREADRATGTFYVHFDNKLQILRAMVGQFSEDLNMSGLDRPEHPPQAAPQVLRVLWTTYRKHSATFRALVEAAAIDAEMAGIYDELHKRARRDYRSMLRGSRNPALAAPRDQELAAAALDMMISGCMYEWLAVEKRPEHFSDERAFNVLAGIMMSVLGI